MIPNILNKITISSIDNNLLKGFRRGIEREALRVDLNGKVSNISHPIFLGSSLTHKWITTDFSESLLEFVTPVNINIIDLLASLRDLHRYVVKNLYNERMWPFSIPCFIKNSDEVKIAQYGSSNIGKFKTVYRNGLKIRYGVHMQMISGLHYNFSFPKNFWIKWSNINDFVFNEKIISKGYLHLIRNYYRFGWIISYLFGSSPAVHSYFLQNTRINLPFKKNKYGMFYLPWATSLRLSDIGYVNRIKKYTSLLFNDLDYYLQILKYAVCTPSKKFSNLELKDSCGCWSQINKNKLQIENEFYTFVRPKGSIKSNKRIIDSLESGGINYIECRSLDINPFSPIGINKYQIMFLDVFFSWCILSESPKIDLLEAKFIDNNWKKILLEGRKPGQVINIGYNNKCESLFVFIKELFVNLKYIADIMDKQNNTYLYKFVCDKFLDFFEYPELTYSSKILNLILNSDYTSLGLSFADRYYKVLLNESYEFFSHEDLVKESKISLLKQKKLEEFDDIMFDDYISNI